MYGKMAMVNEYVYSYGKMQKNSPFDPKDYWVVNGLRSDVKFTVICTRLKSLFCP